MTEEEWGRSTDPMLMACHLWHIHATERKLRLFAVACCRRAIAHIRDDRSLLALRVAEEFADGHAGLDQLNEAWAGAQDATEGVTDRPTQDAQIAVSFAISYDEHWDRNDPDENPFDTASLHARRAIEIACLGDLVTEILHQCALLRDIFGNPFRPVVADPSWLTTTVRGLAAAIYADRAFDRLPVLADALEEAGCDNADVLAHCRGDGPHVRGCWVVDLILGKS